MMDALTAEIAALAARWEQEAETRRVIWLDDPVALTLAHCAAGLRAAHEAAARAAVEDTVDAFARAHQVTPQTVRSWCRLKKVIARQTTSGWMILRDQPVPDRAADRPLERAS